MTGCRQKAADRVVNPELTLPDWDSKKTDSQEGSGYWQESSQSDGTCNLSGFKKSRQMKVTDGKTAEAPVARRLQNTGPKGPASI